MTLFFSRTTAKQWAEWLQAPLEHASDAGNLALVSKLQEAGAAGSAVHAARRGGQHAPARELLRLGTSATETAAVTPLCILLPAWVIMAISCPCFFVRGLYWMR